MTNGSVRTEMNFCPRGEEVIFYPTDRKRSRWPFKPHDVTIHDLRPLRGELSFDRNGFVLVNQTSACQDFYDADEVERVYMPEVIDLVTRLTGADKVIAFGVMTRTNNTEAEEGNLPAFGAHVDYGDRTVRMFSEDVLGAEEAARWLEGRYMLINVWRPIKVVESAPFAVCDASTVAEG
ncbi:MAG TPA: CmcJ/NvfI family oxidoreductase, partial [Gammaproteobacteria bacterium]